MGRPAGLSKLGPENLYPRPLVCGCMVSLRGEGSNCVKCGHPIPWWKRR